MHGRASDVKITRKTIAAAVILFVTLIFALSLVPQAKHSYAFSYDETDVFCVRSDEDFSSIAALSREGKNFTGKTVMLYADVTAPDGNVFTTEFNGEFKGNGFAVKNLTGTLFSSLNGNASSFYLSDASVTGKSLLAKKVEGRLTDVDIYGVLKDGNAVEKNRGYIGNATSYLTVTGGYPFVLDNYGTVENCFVSGAIRSMPKPAETAGGTGSVPYTGTVTTINYSGATVKNSMASFVVNSDYEFIIEPFGSGANNATVENCGTILNVGANVTVKDSHDMKVKTSFTSVSTDGASTATVYDANGATGTDYAALVDGFYIKSGEIPFVKTLFGAAGTETDPFVIADMHDVKRLVFATTSDETQDGYYAKLGGDVFGTNFSSGTDLPSVGTVKLTVSKNGHIFAKTDFDPFASVTLTAAVTVEQGFGGDGYTGSPFTAVVPSEVKGNGTETDPYVVNDAASLAALLLDGAKNVAGKRAIVVNDIILNNVLSSDKVLALTAPDVKLDLDFLGHAFVNAFVAPFGAVYGSVKDITITLSDKENLSYGVCSSVENGGLLERVNVFSLSSNNFTSGFTRRNDGTITLSNSFVGSNYAFCETNGGSITYSAAIYGNEFYSDGEGGIAFCAANGYRISDGETVSDGCGYFDLKADGFDVTTIFGYEVGKEENAPEVRRKGVRYRVAADGCVTINGDALRSFGYKADGYSASEIAESVYQTESGVSMRFSWEYGGATYSAENLISAGEYILRATAYGDDVITTEFEPITVTITKSDYGGEIDFAATDKSYDYSGREITDEPKPNNYAELQGKGFVISYTVTKNGLPSAIADCGTYVQKIYLVSNDYETITFERTITVNKVALTVSVKNASITYGSEFDIASLGTEMLIMTGTVGADKDKTSKQIVEESGFTFNDLFSTDYTNGSDVGSYNVICALKFLYNYDITVENGILQVTKAEFTGIVFGNGTFVYDGTGKSIYVDGEPSGAKVAYEGNGAVKAGVYSIKAVVSHKNYETKPYFANLTINKAVIKITVGDVNKDYGYVFNPDDFGFTAVVPVENEEFSAVTEYVTFAPTLKGGAETLTAGTYDVSLTITGAAENYDFAVTDGRLTIGKASLTTVYAETEYKDILTEYTGAAIDYALPADAFGEINVGVVYKIISGGKEVGEIKEVGYYTVVATVTPLGDDENNYFVTEYSLFAEVTLISPKIKFDKPSYEFVYDGTDKAAEEYGYSTEKMPENPKISVYFTQNGIKVNEMVHAGSYVAVAEFVGDGNFASARATAAVTVKARAAILTVAREYVYNGKAIVPAVTISYADGGSGSLDEKEIAYRFTNSIGMEFGSVAETEKYTVVPTSVNPDYEITSGAFEIEVKPLAVSVTISNMSFQYGAYGEYTTDTGMLEIRSDEIGLTGYEIAETGLVETIRFVLKSGGSGKYFTIGQYEVTTNELVQPKNYVFTLTKPFTVTVTKRALKATWRLDGKTIDSAETAITYAGREQSNRITYSLSGVAPGEDESAINVVKAVKQGINETELLHADRYTVSLVAGGSPNYTFDGTEKLGVIVNKSPLNGIRVYIPGGQVRQYENMPSAAFVIDGLKGNDINVSPYSLKGFTFASVTDYNPLTAKEGDFYSVGGRFSFDDYTIESGRIEKGTVEVIKGYKSYTMSDASFVYDGREKTITINDVEDGVRIEYVNNAHTDVGRYAVSATVVYPTGRTAGISATMVITKGTPIVSAEDAYTVFTGARELTSDDVNATATLNDAIRTVQGTITFIGSRELRRGTNTFNVLFTPKDAKNLNEVRFTKKITAYEVTGASLTFSHSDYTVDTNNKIVTAKVLEVYIDKTPFVGVADDINLYQNGTSVPRATFNRTAKEKLEIRYKSTIVFEITYDVEFGKKPDDNRPEVKVDTGLLEVTGLSFSDDGSTIYLQGEAGVIKMKDGYRDAYDLYIDGVFIQDSYTLRKSTTSINVEIRNKKLSVTQYSKKTAVTTEPKPEPPKDNPDDGKKEFKTYYYYIIAACGVVLAAGIVLLVLKLKK